MGVVVKITNKKPIYKGDLVEAVVTNATLDAVKARVLNTNSALRFVILDEDRLPVSFSYEDFYDLEFRIIGFKKFLEEEVIIWKRLEMD